MKEKNVIWREGKWSVTETFAGQPEYGRHLLYHEDLPHWIAEVIEFSVWKKKYNADPKTFKEIASARRIAALKKWYEKVSLKLEEIDNELWILQE